MKLYIDLSYFHHMNELSLNDIISHLDIEKVNSIEEADVVYSPSVYKDTEEYPNKKYIFGPHFSVFPNNEARKISGKYNNAIYIQPSEPSVKTWVNEFDFKNIPVKSFPFPINLEKYKVSEEKKDSIIIYHKQRCKKELEFLTSFLNLNNINFEIIKYGSYDEDYYQNLLDKCKYIIWLGRHESQGFALQSALAKNIPILVWSVTLRVQEVGSEKLYSSVKSEVTTVPYWDERCGEKFHKKEELKEFFDIFINKLDTYNPREFVKENLSIEKCSNNFLNLIESIGK